MRRSPEVLVARLRNRKGRIIAFGILCLVFAGLAAGHWFVLTRMMPRLIPKEGEDLLWHVVFGQQMVVGIACVQTVLYLLGLGFGTTVAMLIGELTTCTKNDLLVHLWDRVEALERSRPGNSQPPP